MNEKAYADTAYDSTKVNARPSPDNSKLSFTNRKLRKHPVASFVDAQCGEFLSVNDTEIIELLNSTDGRVLKDIAQPGHEMQPWKTLRNPKVAIYTATQVIRFFMIVSWAGAMFFMLFFLFAEPKVLLKPSFYYFFLLPSIFIVLFLIGKYLLKLNVVEDKNNYVLNRRKGTILIPVKNNPNQELPFEEFDPYLNHSAHSSGRICYHLCLCHIYSEEWISCPQEQDDEWGVYQLWDFWQQYMDISKPLPDVPKMEPYRSRDPVTATYDKKHNRPKDYWKNMDIDKADKMQDASIKSAKQYPWGKTRKQALAQGWQPSGCGEGDWQQSSQSNEQANQVDAI